MQHSTSLSALDNV